MNETQAREFAAGLTIHESAEADALLSPEQLGAVVAVPSLDLPGADDVDIVARTGLSAEEAASFATWARHRVTAYILVGPESDGWYPRTLGGWQITARNADMPPDPFL